MELLKFKFKIHDPSKYNCVIDYQKPVIDYQWKNSNFFFEKPHLFKPFWKGTKGLYMCVSDFKKKERDIPRELHCKMLSQQLLDKHLQIYWEFIHELQIVLSTLKERNLSVLLRKSIVIKRLVVSWIMSFLNTRERVSLCVQKL